MKFNLYAIGALFALCMSAPGATPQGDYNLADQGRSANQQAYSLLGHLRLDGAGHIHGVEAFRSRGIVVNATVTGTYTMSTSNAGTISLSALQVDAKEPQTLLHNYRFVVDAGKRIQAIRTDPGVLGDPPRPVGCFDRQPRIAIADAWQDVPAPGVLRFAQATLRFPGAQAAFRYTS